MNSINKILNNVSIIFLLMFAAPSIVPAAMQIRDKPTGSEVLFQDDFHDADTSKANWALEAGTPEMFSFDDGVMHFLTNTSQPGVKLRLAKAGPFSDCEVSFRMRFRSEKSSYAGIRFFNAEKDADKNDYYFVGMTAGERFLQTSTPGGASKYTPLQLTPGIAHDMKITCTGSGFSVAVDGNPVAEIPTAKNVEFNVLFMSWKADVEFGDFIVCRLKEKKETGKVLRNLINNSSFEYASAPNLPDFWGMSSGGLAKDEWIGRLDELWSRWRRDTTDTVDGKYCMRVDGNKLLTSTYLDLQAGNDYTFSAYLKSSVENTKVTLKFSYYKSETLSTNVTVGTAWQRVAWTFFAKDNTGGMLLGYDTDAVLWVDAVQLVMGKDAGTYRRDSYVPGRKSEEKSRIEISAVRTATPPSFDGTLNDPAWKKAARMDLKLLDAGKPTEKTSCFLLYDEKNLYVGFRCFNSQMDKVRAKITQRDGPVWNDDSVELFVGPAGPHGDWAEYFHLGVSITGAMYDANKNDPSWNRDWQAKTARFDDRWEAVLVLPIKMFDLTTFTLGDWIFNACRENRKIKEFSAWSPTFGSFHKAENFGVLKALPKEITMQYVNKTPEIVSADCSFAPTALKVNGKDFIGFGIDWQSGVQPPMENTFKIMRESGMNLLAYYASPFEAKNKQTFDLAEKYNIKIAVWLAPGPLGQNKAPDEIRRQIELYKKYPAVIAWWILDEPMAFPEEVKACLKSAQEADSTRPAYINIEPCGLGMRIAGLPGDILSVDTYNFFFNSSVMADLRPLFGLVQKEITGRPGWVILQHFGNTLWVWRAPSPGEMTAQTYLALIHGLTGIVYQSQIPLRTDTLQQIGVLGKEIKLLEPILLSRELGKINSSNPKIFYCVKKYNGKIYVIAINSNEMELETTITLDKKVSGINDFFTGGSLVKDSSSVVLRFQPFERKVIVFQ